MPAADGTRAAQSARQAERLDRGAVALPTAGGQLITWRALGSDAPGLRFHVERDGERLTAQPQALTQWLDTRALPAGSAPHYRITPVGEDGRAQAAERALWLPEAALRLPLQLPAPHVGADGVAVPYEANDGAPADLDGDGRYEIVLKWQPTNAKDNSQAGHTAPTLIDAYKLDGTRLWRINLGPNIRSGAHYTPYAVFDFDGDGRAELMIRTADGTVDGQGRVLGQAGVDHRNERGYVLRGDEFISVFDGRSGALLASAPYTPPRGELGAWGDTYGNRVDRFLAGVAYLDGQRPSAVFSRGYYTRAVIAAWDWRGGQLTQRWVHDSAVDTPGSRDTQGRSAFGQGAHWFAVSDVDGDGRDDIVYGAATIASGGQLLYSTGLGHGDALHVGQLDPTRAGRQVFMVHESPRSYGEHAIEMHDAATGALLWSAPGNNTDIGRGLCLDIDAAHAGVECWASVGGLYSARGVLIGSAKPRAMNFGLWWDGDLLRETLDGTTVAKWLPESGQLQPLLQGRPAGAASNNGTKATPVFSADILGDWREEVVWRSADNSALLVFTTPHPTPHRLVTLMHDAQYRVQVAAQNAGYNQPPHPSYFLGAGMAAPARPRLLLP
ncbi:rhamnogalacturonate lyase [beta proteobacterium AAP121]|nr:rhamnogalacturonate lyase [beta proteobacterium AAP65]KPF95392.1 rhamnogalacturonate lyase [beta proteobacterium AAP121]